MAGGGLFSDFEPFRATQDEPPRVTLIDFGLSKALLEEGDEEASTDRCSLPRVPCQNCYVLETNRTPCRLIYKNLITPNSTRPTIIIILPFVSGYLYLNS